MGQHTIRNQAAGTAARTCYLRRIRLSMRAMDIELLQFRFSHYNEKVRWALDFKGLVHRRTDLLPGPHMRRTRRLTGQTSTPVLRLGDQFVFGSARIIERLETAFPNAPSLYPRDPAERDLALEYQRHFDLVLGPAVRICVFAAMLDDRSYVPRLFAGAKPWWSRIPYRAAYPLMRPLIRRGNGLVDEFAIRNAERLVNDNMASLERLGKRSRYLVGDTFSIADLTAAALIAPLIDPPHPDMAKPEPKPEALRALELRWRSHAAGRWMLDQYARHRPRSQPMPQPVMNAPLASATTSSES